MNLRIMHKEYTDLLRTYFYQMAATSILYQTLTKTYKNQTPLILNNRQPKDDGGRTIKKQRSN